ncbi:hypothetical protein G1H10_10460 [Phytoactinopolyspora halotolerans]|uniref:Uncharacterized protein n=1 Tax=Phytoactinopolyspora halotolerans TaxID=1981512 RepID=A0A6L9S9F8_9ACTN|nr:hypothetical protein [Phytoactinopolyspora halotolerans]
MGRLPEHDEPEHDEPEHDEPEHDEPEHDEPEHHEPGTTHERDAPVYRRGEEEHHGSRRGTVWLLASGGYR